MRILRPFRTLAYAVVLVAAAGYIVFSAGRQPAFINGTFVGQATAAIFGKVRSTGRQNASYHFHQNEKSWTILDPSRALGAKFVMCTISSVPYRTGFWHPTVEERGVRVDFYDPSATVQLDTATRRELLIALDTAHPGTVPAHALMSYVNGGTSTRRILWLGVLGDLSILAAFAAVIFSIVKLRREIRWRKPGCCTECDYDLAGLTADKCPECGAAVKAAPRS